MTQAFQLNPRPIFVPQKTERNEEYLKFIRKLPCCACGKSRGVEAAHFGPRGLGTRASDKNALPVCYKCHRTGPHAYHKLGPRKFAAYHKINPPSLILKLNRFWDEKLNGKAA